MLTEYFDQHQLWCAIILERFIAWRHLVFKYSIWGKKDNLLSQYKPRNLTSLTTGSKWLFRKSDGSGCNFIWLQKCKTQVLALENLKPLQSVNLVNLLRTSCNFLSAMCMNLDRKQTKKSCTYRKFSISLAKQFVMLLILRINRVLESTPPWRTLASCSNSSEKVLESLILNLRLLR